MHLEVLNITFIKSPPESKSGGDQAHHNIKSPIRNKIWGRKAQLQNSLSTALVLDKLMTLASFSNYCYTSKSVRIDWSLTPLSTSYVLSWRSVLLAEEFGEPKRNRWPSASNWRRPRWSEWMVFYVTLHSFLVISWRCLLVTDITGVTT